MHAAWHFLFSFLVFSMVLLLAIVSGLRSARSYGLGKHYIPRVSQTRGLSKLAAYSLSVMDGKRARITKDDLCDHIWEFQFNGAAPEYWRNLDPYWKATTPLMRRCFHPDGIQTADATDMVWGGHERCKPVTAL